MSKFAPTAAQSRAADPRTSVWVTANAGTGKTRVLADRVLRLLLDRAPPESILCLTFTRAAAVEMTERIEERLAIWAVAGDEEQLADDLERLEGRRPNAERLAWARGLFATVLDLPQGLLIMTIHAFCASLLRRFPLEAGIPPHFEQVDDRSAAELMAQARAWLLTDAPQADPLLAIALDRLISLMAEATLSDVFGELVTNRRAVQSALERHGGVDGLEAAIYARLGVDPNLDSRALADRAGTASDIDVAALRMAARCLIDEGSKTDAQHGHWIAEWLALGDDARRQTLETYKRAFMTEKGQGRASVCTKSFAKKFPEHQRALVREQARLVQLEEQIRACLAAERSAAILRVGAALIERYRHIKARHAVLDYDDLIEQAAALLASPSSRDWVLFKLDERLEHLLVDEAQDTSPAQWRIIQSLVEEFGAGEGQHHIQRTLFVVGDEKQSIYSFQGADLENFQAIKARIAERLAPRQETLTQSFRTSRAILDLVDAVASDPVIALGLGAQSGEIKHTTSRVDDPGEVLLLPLVPATEQAVVDEPWALPTATQFQPSAEERLALYVAQTIAERLASPEPLASTKKRARASDVIVLVSKRGRIQELIIRALKHLGIAVAGADRLQLTEHIAVQDLIALGHALLLPEDDLNFACLLKSPLLGLGEEELFELAYDRGDRFLVQRLAELAEAPPFQGVWSLFERWRARADFVPPFELFCEVLDDAGRERILARLGPDAAEPIEAFLAQALAYEDGHPATLQGFLHWLQIDDSTLKRDPEPARDEVRVMTVHGAKGLEAPIVILADAATAAAGRANLLEIDAQRDLIFWRGAAAEQPAEIGELVEIRRAALSQERHRLLYVALTRAKDQLWIAGWHGRRKNSTQGSWYEAIERALGGLEGVENLPGPAYAPDQSVRRLVRGGEVTAAQETEKPELNDVPLPDWFGPARHEAKPLVIRNPSQNADDEPPAASPRHYRAAGRQFGAELHLLLHKLSDLPTEQREAALLRAVEPARRSMGEARALELCRQVRGVLAHEDLAFAFGRGSRAEQPIVGRVGGVVVSGQIDRMVVRDGYVAIIDFKSDRVPPSDPTQIPRAYLRQLGAYVSVLARIYPDFAMRCGLVWTVVPELQLVPEQLIAGYRLE